MLPRRAEHAAPVAVEQGVIHRHVNAWPSAVDAATTSRARPPQRVGVPAGVGEESVRRDQCASGHPGSGPHASHRPRLDRPNAR